MDVKYRSRALGQGVSLKGTSRTITMQCFTLGAITDAEKTKLRRKKKNKANGPRNTGQWHQINVHG